MATKLPNMYSNHQRAPCRVIIIGRVINSVAQSFVAINLVCKITWERYTTASDTVLLKDCVWCSFVPILQRMC